MGDTFFEARRAAGLSCGCVSSFSSPSAASSSSASASVICSSSLSSSYEKVSVYHGKVSKRCTHLLVIIVLAVVHILGLDHDEVLADELPEPERREWPASAVHERANAVLLRLRQDFLVERPKPAGAFCEASEAAQWSAGKALTP